MTEGLELVIKEEEANQKKRNDYIDTLDFDCTGEWQQRFDKNYAVKKCVSKACDELENTSMFGSDEDE